MALPTTVTAVTIDDLRLTADGAYLAASLLPNSLAVFAVAPSCALTPVLGSPFGAPSGLSGLRFNASGSRLFAALANDTDTEVAVFSLPFNPTQIPGSPFAFASGVNSNVVQLNPAETKLYVSNQDSATITVLDVAPSGALSLSAVAGNPFSITTMRPAGMAMDPAGKVLLVASDGGVHSFAVAANGGLTPAPGSPVDAATIGPQSLVFLPGARLQGAACTADTDCGTGICTDGVCCDSVCGGGDAGDCQACSIATGAPTDGTCAPLNGTTCDDGNDCTSNICATGTCVATPLPNDTVCDDANDCTEGDVCTAAACAGINRPDGSSCDDHDLCTQTDMCQSGQCDGSNPVSCSAPDQCHDAFCVPATGLCATPALPDSTPCEADGDVVCTPFDACDSGTCVAGRRGASLYVTPAGSDSGNDCTDPLNPCATIQHGVDAACAYDSLSVGDGTYRENVVVPRTLVIYGAGQAGTVVQPAISNPDCGGAGGGNPLCSGGSSVFLIQADGVVIRGLTVEGDNPDLTSNVSRNGADIDARNGIITDSQIGMFDDLVVNQVTVRDVYLRGVQVASSSHQLTDNQIINVRGDDDYSIGIASSGVPGSAGFIGFNTIDTASTGVGVSHSAGCRIQDNEIRHAGLGIHLDSAGDTGGTPDEVIFNTVLDCDTLSSTPSDIGILVSAPYRGPSVEGNLVMNCGTGLAQYGEGSPSVATLFRANTVDGVSAPGSVGANVSTDLQNGSSSNVLATFQFNRLTNNETGLRAQQQNGFTAMVTATNNSFTNNSYAAVDAGAAGASLTCNLIADNEAGVLATSPAVGAHTNSIVGNALGADGSAIVSGSMSATDNWWGCGAGPGNLGCDSVTAKVDTQPVLSGPPKCLACAADTDCSDNRACNGVETCNLSFEVCEAGASPTCTLPSDKDPRCNAPLCVEPDGHCAVQQYPDGTPCNSGDDCQAGVCTGPNSLRLIMARLRSSGTGRHAGGRMTLRAMINDDSTGGTLSADLLAGKVTLDVSDGATFRSKIPLTSCRGVGESARCSNNELHARVSFHWMGSRSPNSYVLRIRQAKMDGAKTGPGQPSGPVGVIVHQALVDRAASIAGGACQTSGAMGLVCSAP